MFYIAVGINNINSSIKSDISEKEYNIYKKNREQTIFTTVEDGEKMFGEDRFLEIFSWIEDYFKTIVSINENSKNRVTNKRKVSSILE